tara:strand:- start:1461 stop:2132 length:672 start_codon:yes stop_codon:yes gene_type:complete
MESDKLRQEIKFNTYSIYENNILNWLRLNNFHEIFNKRHVNNIYFDDLNLQCLMANLHGDSNRFKIRLRWYDNNLDNLFFEIKIKKNIFGYKKIYKIKDLFIYHGISKNSLINSIEKKLPKDFNNRFNRFKFIQLVNSYDRRYYLSSDKKFRITIDKNIQTFDQRKNDVLNLTHKFFSQDKMVVEIKCQKLDQKKIITLFNDFPLRASKNSKYVDGQRLSLGF